MGKCSRGQEIGDHCLNQDCTLSIISNPGEWVRWEVVLVGGSMCRSSGNPSVPGRTEQCELANFCRVSRGIVNSVLLFKKTNISFAQDEG